MRVDDDDDDDSLRVCCLRLWRLHMRADFDGVWTKGSVYYQLNTLYQHRYYCYCAPLMVYLSGSIFPLVVVVLGVVSILLTVTAYHSAIPHSAML